MSFRSLWTFCLLIPAAELFAVEPPPAPAKFLLEWGRRGKADGEFIAPIGIAINAADEVYVSDFYNDRVQKFSSTGKFLGAFSVLPFPGGLAVDASDEIYIAHFGIHQPKEKRKPDRISVYSSSGKLARQWGDTGTGDGEFDMPGGIAISREGLVYITDQTNRRVQVFDKQGKFVRKWGQYGTKPGEFGGNSKPNSRVGGPQFVAFDSAGNVYTTEGSMCRIQKFTSAGKFLASWGDNADQPGSFGGEHHKLFGPISLCIDRHDRLWISAVSGRIQQFSDSGRFLHGFGDTRGTGPGQFRVPHGLALDSHGDLYVVDTFNHRIQKFSVAP